MPRLVLTVLPDVAAGAVRVLGGAMPGGVRARIENGAVVLFGMPSRVGQGLVLLQVGRIGAAGTVWGTTVRVRWTVVALPAFAAGNFAGYALEIGDDGVTNACGRAELTVAVNGRISGKLQVGGKTYAVSDAGYDSSDGTVFTATNLLIRVGMVQFAARLDVSDAGVTLAGGAIDAALWRLTWSRAAPVPAPVPGYYTLTLPRIGTTEVFGSGYLSMNVDSLGVVRTSGKLADGTVVSFSGALVRSADDRLWTVLYTVPTAYAGGSFCGMVEFVAVPDGTVVLRLLDEVGSMWWTSRNPRATATFGEGFFREVGVVGGRYSAWSVLRTYYEGLSMAVAPLSQPTAATTVWVTNAVSVVVNSAGTGLTLAAGGGTDDNPAYLSLVFNRTTGLMSGSFRGYYPSSFSSATVYRSYAYAGMMTPVRENPADGVEGRGFWLVPEKATPSGVWPYTVQHSQDFVVESDTEEK